MDAKLLAQYVVAYFDSKGDLITNKKLQKLLYYIDSWGLVHFDAPIVQQEFEAWVHGPVVRDVYFEYYRFGYSPINISYPNRESVDSFLSTLVNTNEELKNKQELIDDVLEQYGSLTSAQLELLSHSEDPWIKARNGIPPFEASSQIIDKGLMKDYYQSLL